MQEDSGLMREFGVGEEIPKDKGWHDMTVGQIVQFNSCYFRIIQVDTVFQKMILEPMKKADAQNEILTAGMDKIKNALRG